MHLTLWTQYGRESYEYRLFSPAVTITQRISQAGKTFTPYSSHSFCPHLFGLLYLMRGRVPRIKFTHLIFRLCYLDIELSCGRERLLAEKTLVTFAHYAVLNQSTQHVPTFHIDGK